MSEKILLLHQYNGGNPPFRLNPVGFAKCTFLVIFLGGKPITPLIAAPNGDCANEKTKDRAKKLDYRLHV
jgi:hypothetical protein